MKKAETKSNIVLVGTYRPENEAWIRERRLYNLPLPVFVGRKDGRAAAPPGGLRSVATALPFHKNINAVVLFAEGHPNFAFKAKFKDVVDGEWLAANGYIRDGRASARPHAAAYALYELLEESTPAKLLGRKSAEVFVSSSRCPVVKIDEAFYSRPYPVTGGREAQDAVANLKSQFVTSSWGGVRKRPFAFTENGIAMLSGVLRSQTAIEINIRIMRVFVAIRRFAIANMGILQRLGAVEVKQAVMDEKLNAVLGQIKCREFPPERIFYDGHEYDAYDKIVEFIRKARRDIVVIDAYADNVVLQILGKKRTGVSVTVVKGPRARLTTLDVSKFNAQFANSLTVKTSPAFHDRFIIIDQSLLLHVGASLNYIGKKCFAISVLDAANIPSIMGRI